MPSTANIPTLFPALASDSLLAFQFSSWYPRFSSLSIKSTIIRPLSQEFREYLDSDSVFVPEGAEDVPAESTLSDDEGYDLEGSEEADELQRKFAFPDLDAQIREAISDYGAVFPKLNFSSPRDSAWILPASSPLKCTSPADVYLLLKSSDFVQHDLDINLVFDGCEPQPSFGADATIHVDYELELVLRKWYPVDRSRELRCFVRQEVLLGLSQRDPNYYDFWNGPGTQSRVVEAVTHFWESHIKGKWEQTHGDCKRFLRASRGLELSIHPLFASQTPSIYCSHATSPMRTSLTSTLMRHAQTRCSSRTTTCS
ncbi:hypothetical protein AcV7_009632 [Taiwanofungus camphoratus]|nr:hypothetical protein AcV7_009632 [Antrodia cinnamomea]